MIARPSANARLRLVTRIAVGIGALIDGSVAILALFFQSALGPLLDVPVHDPMLATIAGGETAVAACVYLTVLRDLERFRPLLYILALDQTFAVLLPALEMGRGHMIASVKTIAPMPFSALLAAIYLYAARKLGAD